MLALISLSSCGSKWSGFPGITEEIEKSVFENAAKLELEVCSGINDDNFIGAREFFIIDSNYVMIERTSDSGGPFISILRVSDTTIIADYFKKGRGPGELLISNICMDSKSIQVDDFIKK
ncbi:MAG: hypothetical protein HUJ98_02655, partial [Bacteroidaceae bacterium]|nr:hypothetical protein [Bacteroidaceae bacterium]